MANYPPELAEIARFSATRTTRRDIIGRELAEALGTEWAPQGTVGRSGLCLVRYLPTNVDFVAVPGGRFQMGFREDDRVALSNHFDLDAPQIAQFVGTFERHCRPIHDVEVVPHLFSRSQLTYDQVVAFATGHDSDEFLLDEAVEFLRDLPFRLPTEAEFEWCAREGGTASFVHDIAARYPGKGRMPVLDLENSFGLRALLCPQWVADDWHETYDGAPRSSEIAWTGGHVAGVLRGQIDSAIEGPLDLLYCLAAHRANGQYAQGFITMRICRSL